VISRKRGLVPIVASAEALFRFGVLSKVLARELGGQKRARALRAVAADDHLDLDGSLRRVTLRTLYRWVAAYETDGLDGLEPRRRSTARVSAVLGDALLDFVRDEKTTDPRASVPELIRRARQHKVIAPDDPVDRTTLWRAVRRMGLPTRMRPSKAEGDMRRFAYPHRMMMVLADGKHFRAGGDRRKRVALFFIDDATRKGIHVVVGTSESTELFLRGLYELVRKVGFMLVTYLDNGPGFISGDTLTVFAHLPGVHLVHGTAGYPEGRGKVERFNRTAINDVLRALDGAAEVDPDCRALELRLDHFLGQYNRRPHESLAGQCPTERWDADPRALRFPESDDELRELFVVTDSRQVSKDHVIRFDGGEYEAPRGLGGSSVVVHRRLLDQELFIIHDGRALRLHPVDREANARGRRACRDQPETPATGEGVPRTAATLAFDADHGPVVDREGGFIAPEKEK
jgi:transposase InsO family protein